MFDEIAPRYDFLNHFLSMGVDRYWRWRTVRIVRPEEGMRVLDVCTGTGDLALAFWRAGKKKVAVDGVDFAEAMLEIGRRKVEKASAGDHITLQQGDAMALPFDDDAFDIVSVAFGLRNVADTAVGLREMTRVCRKGGRVAILEFSMPTRWPIRPLYGWYFRHVLPRIGQLLARNRQSAYHYLPESVGEFPQGQAMAALMEDAGLGEIQIRPMTFGIATLYVGWKKER